MYPRNFVYHSPSSLDEALSLLSELKEGAKILAGGQSLIPMMKLRIVSPEHIIDINNISSLDYIRKQDGHIVIGALTRMSTIQDSVMIRKELSILSECAEQVADPLVRNMGTIGGNVAHADPSNDVPAVAVASDCKIVCASKSGEREVQASEFFVDTFTTALRQDEIVKELKFPLDGRKGSYVKLERIAGDFGVAGSAVTLKLRRGVVEKCRIALTGVGPKVIHATRAEESMLGQRITRKGIQEASRLASEQAEPVSDLRGTVEFKKKAVELITRSALINTARRFGVRP